MNALPVTVLILALLSSSFAGCSETTRAQSKEEHQEGEGHHSEQRKIVVTSPVSEDVVSTKPFVCQIHSRRHIEVRALDSGYLQEVNVQEGQSVKQGQVMFKIVPVLYKARLDSEAAEAELAQIRYANTKNLSSKSIVSDQEVALAKAELSRAQAKVELAKAELNFTALKAPFDGIVDRQHEQQGSLVSEGDILSTLSDNQVMWVYFNVPEARYLEYKTGNNGTEGLDVELQLANGEIFPQPGKIGAIEADFNNETGNIAFRADFPNPDGLLRHGQTGTILIHRKVPNATVIPQRATFEILANKYVYVVEPDTKAGAQQGSGHAAEHADNGHESAAAHGDEHAAAAHGDEHAAAAHGDEHAASAHGAEQAGPQHGFGTVRQRQIVIQEEMDDVYVIKSGLDVNDKIIFEGVKQVRDGDRVEYELRPAKQILANLKYHAE